VTQDLSIGILVGGRNALVDTEQLRVIVENLGAYPHHVQFGGLPNEALVIEPHDGGWRVF
jgi:hypothetical protein